MNPDRDLAHMVGDARKRLMSDIDAPAVAHNGPITDIPASHDEVHAHEDVDWHLMRGED